ncbi:MAG: endolytic transglycosylase MltG [Lachnospiraceae bacterium]|nr:endolytic transglycosylase MltG [Lachnospiraceae bacterium]
MKRKYFLRGLGAGIILSAVVMGVTSSKADLTDAEIRKRALELGMVEKPDALDSVLKATATSAAVEATKHLETTEPTGFPTVIPEITQKPATISQQVTTQKPTITSVPNPTQKPIVTITPKVTQKPASKTAPPQRQIISVTITAGMWSEQIAEKFKELGLVDDAKAFNKFLCDNDYASSIDIGDYKIPKGSSYEQIAKIITK